MFSRRWALPALLGLTVLSLSACTTLNDRGIFSGRFPYPDSRAPRRGPVYDRPADPRTSGAYRNIRRDAGRYANVLDRELRLNNRQERAIERLLIDRTERLLRRANPRDHHRVYPFPRDSRLSRDARSWWNQTDRQIERALDRRQRDAYRRIARDLERHGRYDRRDYDGDRGDGRWGRDDHRGRGHDDHGRGRGRGHDHD